MVIDVHLYPWCEEAYHGEKKKIADMMSAYNSRNLKGAMRMLNAIMDQFTLEDYIAIMDKFAIDKAVIVAYDVTPTYGFVIATNEDIADFIKKYPNRYIGFGSIDVPSPHAIDQLKYAISSLKLRSIKLIPPVQKFYYSDKKYDPSWLKMIDLNNVAKLLKIKN
ncbi:MAG: amidohydrolase family protein [Promethearchaeota archaeon]